MKRLFRAALQGGMVTLLVLLALTSCSLNPQGQSSSSPSSSATTTGGQTPPPTTPPTPTIPPIQHISLGNFQTSLVWPGAPGLLLYPAERPTSAGMSSLYFYSYATQSVSQIASAPTEPDGSQGGIRGAAYGGSDWVSYVTEDANQGNWVLWAYNVATGQRIQVDSAAQEQLTGPWNSQWVSSATDLIWSVVNWSSLSTKLLDFSYSTGQTQTLYTQAGMQITPVAVSDVGILLVEADANANASMWLLRHGQSAPAQIATDAGGNASMNDQYAAWDNGHSQTTTLYDLSAGSEIQGWARCIRPALAASQPYMMCLDYGAQAWVLAHVPYSGATVEFDVGQANLGTGGEIYNGRAFWLGPSASNGLGTNDIEYVDLPTQ